MDPRVGLMMIVGGPGQAEIKTSGSRLELCTST